MLYTVKYAPKKLDDILGNKEKIDYIRTWILNWLSGKKRKPLLIWGPSGTGKTGIAYVLKQEFNLDLLEMNASELRNKNRVERILGGSLLASTLFGTTRLLLIDDIDILAGRKDSGGSAAIKNFARDASYPVIITATDLWDKKLAAIRGECDKVELKRINKLSIRKLLEHITDTEKLDISKERVDAIADNSSGDVRAALNDLQSLMPSQRLREKDIFQIIRTILKSDNYAEVKEALSGNIDYDSIKLWVDENIPNEYKTSEDIAAAYNSLSKADIFDGRIAHQYWKLLKYSIDLATFGVAAAKKGVYRHFTTYTFPSYLRNMSSTMSRMAMMKSIGLKMGSKLHTNRRDALEYLPLIKELGKDHTELMMEFYEFDEEELAFVMDTSVSKIKTKKVKD
ncbi:replication factor C large subunit [Candidatus Micrarchaeota archaeon]|nr:replication factor C large subunit [Candidatus Micrarchaeota archaeon]